MPIIPSAEGEPCCPPLADQPLDSDWAGELARMFKALGDPIRLRILSLVASHDGGECCVCDITPAFEVSQPTISTITSRPCAKRAYLTANAAVPGCTTG